MNSDEAPVALPASFEPLLLTFHPDVRQVDGRRVIGADSVCDIVVDVASGQVSACDSTGTLPARFMNSSESQLAQVVHAYSAYAAEVRHIDEEAGQLGAVARLRSNLAAIDPAATADPNNWWSVVLQQAEDGLL